MRRPVLIITLTAVSACAAPGGSDDASASSGAEALPFTVPMDPGTISCAEIANPAALAVGTDWTLGQARAALLAGTRSDLPAADTVSAALASFCAANPSARLRDAAGSLGI